MTSLQLSIACMHVRVPSLQPYIACMHVRVRVRVCVCVCAGCEGPAQPGSRERGDVDQPQHFRTCHVSHDRQQQTHDTFICGKSWADAFSEQALLELSPKLSSDFGSGSRSQSPGGGRAKICAAT